VDRRRFDAAVTLVDAKAKTIVAKWENEGPLPQECAPTIHRRSTDPKPQPIDGGEPNFVAGLLQLEAFQKRPAGQKR
jgi:hypothetical protein